MDEGFLMSDNEISAVVGGAGKPAYRYYTSVSGDTLWSIAQQFRTTAEEICRLNNLDAGSELAEGTVLLVPNK